jgi:voltage-gated potassium channel
MVSKEWRSNAFLTVERVTELPLAILSVVMLPLLILPLLVDLPQRTREAFLAADWLIWAIFAMELMVKTYLAPARLTYLRRHWFDVVIVVVPFLRPLRVIRSARALRALRGLRLLSFAVRAVHSSRSILAEHGLQYVLVFGLILVLVCAGLISYFEAGSDGSIQDFDDGLWWAITTVTTVGYGDKFPVTSEGRALAGFLMLVGIALFGLITANLAAFLVAPREDKAAASLEDVMESLRRLEAKVEELSTRQRAPDSNGD